MEKNVYEEENAATVARDSRQENGQKRKRSKAMEKEITFEIKEHLGIFDDNNDKWIGQVNRVSWNGNEPKIDIRYWNVEDTSKNRKVGTLSFDSAKRLAEILSKITG